MFDMLTDAELQELDDRAYRAAIRLYDTAGEVHAQMAALPTAGEEWKSLQRTAGVIMAAAREQDEMSSTVARERRERREDARQARAAEITALAAAYPLTRPLVSTRDTSGDMAPAELREFEANWTAE